jgi:hypothetical protein
LGSVARVGGGVVTEQLRKRGGCFGARWPAEQCLIPADLVADGGQDLRDVVGEGPARGEVVADQHGQGVDCATDVWSRRVRGGLSSSACTQRVCEPEEVARSGGVARGDGDRILVEGAGGDVADAGCPACLVENDREVADEAVAGGAAGDTGQRSCGDSDVVDVVLGVGHASASPFGSVMAARCC